MTPDEQIAVIAARRDGKPVRWRIKESSQEAAATWYEMALTDDFDFRYREYKIAPTGPRKPAELWMHKDSASAMPFISLHNLIGVRNLWGESGICFREVVEADKEADERAAIVIATRGGYNIDNTMRDFCVGFRAALKYRDNGSNLP